jgi:hypothetical protein
MARPEVTGKKVRAAGVATNETNDDAETDELDDDFDWIDIAEVQRMNGGSSRSTVYDDPEIRALAVSFTDPGRRVGRVRWRRHEMAALILSRIARRDAEAEAVRARITAQQERRKAKRRITG